MSGAPSSAPPPGPPLPPGGLPPDDNRAILLLGIYWGLFPLTVVSVGLRFYVRLRIRQIGWDDWWMLGAWLLYLGSLIISTLVANAGGARHVYFIPLPTAIYVVKLTYIVQPFSIMCNAMAKTSITILLQRLMGHDAFIKKTILWTAMGIFWILCILTSIIAFTDCSPPSAHWNLTDPNAQNECWPNYVIEPINLVQGSWGAFQDFFLALFPIWILWSVQISLRKKVSIALLLSLGIFSGVSGILKTSYVPSVTNDVDKTWLVADLFLWASVESCLYIFCGSVPTLKPLWDSWTQNRSLDPTNRSARSGGHSSDGSTGARGSRFRLWHRSRGASHFSGKDVSNVSGTTDSREQPLHDTWRNNKYKIVESVHDLKQPSIDR